jgi:mono/diheme cytochrome c family protein
MRTKRFFAPALIAACALVAAFTLVPTGSASGPKTVTFNKDVAPIFYKACAECHRPGESAPMSLLTYKDARPWAKSIREQVAKRTMPPWHADPHVGQWANDRRLTDAEVKTITAWVDGGAKEGDAKDLPPAPQFAEGWNIGKPDVVIEMPEEFTLEASGPDEYQYFDVPTNFAEDRYVKMAEARPGNRKIVHHILAFIVAPGAPNMSKMPKEAREKAVEMSLRNTPLYRDGFLIRMKPETPVYNDGAEIPVEQRRFNNTNSNFLAAYAPGASAGVFEPGVAKKVPAGAIIRFQVHYSKVAGSVQKDRSMVGMVFAKEPPQKLLTTRALDNAFFQIPPAAERHKVTALWNVKNDVVFYSLMPHMHYRGAAMDVKAFYPDGRTEVLLNVPHYSFSWQTKYDLKKPARLPRGSRVVVTGYFDNTAKNKFNPDPAKAVRWGEPTYDEMMMCFVDYVVERPALAKVDAKTYDAYAGRYQLPTGAVVTVARDGDRLFIQQQGRPKRELLPESEAKFYIREFEASYTFVKNAGGEVAEMVYEFDDTTLRAKRLKDAAAGGGN